MADPLTSIRCARGPMHERASEEHGLGQSNVLRRLNSQGVGRQLAVCTNKMQFVAQALPMGLHRNGRVIVFV